GDHPGDHARGLRYPGTGDPGPGLRRTPGAAARQTPHHHWKGPLMNTTTRTRPTHAPVRAAVVGVDKLSEHFTRITFAAPGVGTPDVPIYDQRIKLIFPAPGHPLPDLGADWYASWCALPEDTRGVMRT